MAKRFIILWGFLFLSNSVKSQPSELFFHGFKDSDNNISLNGAAEIEYNGIIKLTNDTTRLIGHAFYSTPFRFKNSRKAFSFSAAFAFAIVPEYPKLGGHGLAFTISPTKELHGSLPSQYLGLLTNQTLGISQIAFLLLNSILSRTLNLVTSAITTLGSTLTAWFPTNLSLLLISKTMVQPKKCLISKVVM